MPIRTNRGRAVVYRRLWAWPLRSPRHLAMAGLIVAVLVIVVGILMPNDSNPLYPRGAGRISTSTTAHGTSTPGTQPPGQAGAPAASAGATTTSRVPAVTTTPPAPAPAAPEALDVANAWARAWVNHPDGMTNEQWVAQLAPLTTDEYLPQLRTVDPANIPSTAVTGPATPVTATAKAVEVDVDTDGARLHLTVIATPVGWRVDAYERSE